MSAENLGRQMFSVWFFKKIVKINCRVQRTTSLEALLHDPQINCSYFAFYVPECNFVTFHVVSIANVSNLQTHIQLLLSRIGEVGRCFHSIRIIHLAASQRMRLMQSKPKIWMHSFFFYFFKKWRTCQFYSSPWSLRKTKTISSSAAAQFSLLVLHHMKVRPISV